MIDWEPLHQLVPAWREHTAHLNAAHFARHGDFARWRAALEALPELTATTIELTERVSVSGPISDAERMVLEQALQGLHPWRKGPFDLFGLHIDTEWRSDWKWRRLAPHLAGLGGANVLDIGCGNGYFGWRLLGAGAASVIGVDPSLLFFLQHLAISRYLPDLPNWLLPLRFEELTPAQFDTVLSMGVIYHRRDPQEHAGRLFEFTRPGGSVVLESLIVAGDENLKPRGRYARMRNVHVVPCTDQMVDWLQAAGFSDVEVVDVTPTTLAEQRSTAWMRFESLQQALDPRDASLTIEGHPAPVRAIVVGRRPT